MVVLDDVEMGLVGAEFGGVAAFGGAEAFGEGGFDEGSEFSMSGFFGTEDEKIGGFEITELNGT